MDSTVRARLRGIWRGMKQRCNNPTSQAYMYYGARGIRICNEWEDNFDAFAEWALTHGYSKELTMDRINNNGDYEPGNCRWADMKTQIANKRPAYCGRLYWYFGKRWTVETICEEKGLNRDTVLHYLRRGKTFSMAVAQAGKERVKDGKTNIRQER